jgi:TonB-linked SusC/RagA family outer membrane protein
MGSAAYSYASKYLIKATVRRDGFSGFSENNKTGIFPSLGIGWVISEENFMKQIPVINYLKLRASYGENGNKVARYSSLARVTANDASKYVFGDGGLTAIGRSVTSLANSDLKWERTRGINIGLDFSILKNRIDGNVEYYNSDTYDLLWEKVLPQTSGFSSVFTNIGQLNNTGIELMLHAAVIKTTDFSWDVTVNFTKNNNKVVKLLGLDANKDGLEDDLIASGLFIGKPIGTIYGYETQGVYQLTDKKLAGYSAGTYRLNDLNGDGKITAADDRMILGNREPAFLMGMQNTLSYKQFTLRAFINSIQGGESSYLASNAPTGYNGTPGQATNSNWFDFTDFWSPRNPNSPYATPWIPVPAGGTVYQQRNFVRLQDISFSYSLTDKAAKKIGVANAKLFVSGKNLVTVTNWKGWDPEVGLGLASYNAFPVLKSYSVGLEITF